MIPAFPKPSQIKQPKPAVRIYRDGREACQLNTKAGRDEYSQRTRLMWERQGKTCRICHKRLALANAVFEHEQGRGFDGSHRDDRIEVDGKPINGAACIICNTKKGSRRGYDLDDFIP